MERSSSGRPTWRRLHRCPGRGRLCSPPAWESQQAAADTGVDRFDGLEAPGHGQVEVAVTVHVEPGGLDLYADRQMIEQVLINLLSNAVKFTESGSITIRARDESEGTLLIDVAEATSDALIKLVWWILWTAPIGIFGLAAPVTAQLGWGLIQSLAVFVVTVIILAFIQWTLVYLPAMWFLGRISPLEFHKATLGTTAIGFGTTSSMASLPSPA